MGTVITLTIDDTVLEARTQSKDCTGVELIELFCALMRGQTFSEGVIIDSLKDALENLEGC